ncbi:hypothetical protein BH11BAC2_BH11BAC2_02360 [soil metagenome]
MKDIIIGIVLSALVVALLEIFKTLNRKLLGSLTLSGIAFIYIGFTWIDLQSLALAIVGVAGFLSLAYFGFTYNYKLIVWGLLLHGLWDIAYPHFGIGVPQGYDKFCITVDFLLALYFNWRLYPISAMSLSKP